MMVVDTSVLLAIYLAEPHGIWAQSQLVKHADELLMSTVNLAEVLIIIRDRVPERATALEAALLASTIRFVPPNTQQAQLVAQARMSLPLNLGDCFVYALATTNKCPILTLDDDSRKCGRPVVMP